MTNPDFNIGIHYEPLPAGLTAICITYPPGMGPEEIITAMFEAVKIVIADHADPNQLDQANQSVKEALAQILED